MLSDMHRKPRRLLRHSYRLVEALTLGEGPRWNTTVRLDKQEEDEYEDDMITYANESLAPSHYLMLNRSRCQISKQWSLKSKKTEGITPIYKAYSNSQTEVTFHLACCSIEPCTNLKVRLHHQIISPPISWIWPMTIRIRTTRVLWRTKRAHLTNAIAMII